MAKNDGKHLPQIEWFYDGYIFPFIGKADLKTLIEWRTSKINSENFSYYNKDARNTYFQHIDCIEQCIKLLFSNPTPEFAISELEKMKKLKEKEKKESQARADDFFNKLSDEEKSELSKILKSSK
jgi:hypothetical protein